MKQVSQFKSLWNPPAHAISGSTVCLSLEIHRLSATMSDYELSVSKRSKRSSPNTRANFWGYTKISSTRKRTLHWYELVNQFLRKIRAVVFPHPSPSLFSEFRSVWRLPVSTTEETFTGELFCVVRWDKRCSTGGLTKNGFQQCFYKLYKHWQKCIVGQGESFEDGCASVCEIFRVRLHLLPELLYCIIYVTAIIN